MKPLCTAVILSAFFFALFFAVATPFYETNDDLYMQFIASGFYTGQPSEYLVFTHVAIGKVLRSLYEISRNHNWYFLYVIGVHFVSITAIFWTILSRRFNRVFLALCAIFFLVAETRMLLRPQFTTTAFLAGTAGLLLLVEGMGPGRAVRWGRTLLGFGFIGLMVMVRSDVALLFIPLVCPFLIERFGLVGWRRLCVFALVYAAIFGGLTCADRAYYARDKGWAEFHEYNLIRGAIQKTPKTHFVAQAGRAAGWSDNDGEMFVESFFADPETFGSVPKMRLLLNELEKLTRGDLLKPGTIVRGLGSYLSKPVNFGSEADAVFCLSLLVAAALVYAARGHRRRLFLTLLASYVIIEAIGFFLRYTARLPERVSYNMPFLMLTLCLYWAARLSDLPVPIPWLNRFSLRRLDGLRVQIKRYRRPLVVLWTGGVLFFAGSLFYQLWLVDGTNRQIKKTSLRFGEPFQKLRSDGQPKPILVPLPRMSRLEQSLFFVAPGTELPFYLVPASWTTHSPVFREFLQQRQLTSLSRDLVERPDVLFLMQDLWIETLQTFYQEHYKLNVRFDRVIPGDKWIKSGKFPRIHHAYQAKVVAEPVSKLSKPTTPSRANKEDPE